MSEAEQLRHLAALGMTVAEIARQLGTYHAWVTRRAAKLGIAVTRGKRNVRPAQRERMAFLKRNGKSLSQIAADLSLDRSTVKRNLKKRPRYPTCAQAFPRDAQSVNAV